ncbi:hypothetical protein [Parafrankia sp. BMG5.11]|uniref:hypothetical protein n=1 Tax=Parafrankia sp. BMG5.11 TaxID=222540 RepID=UPI001039FCA6|nr:hypothetical protein [Parafrankia sp. BMG5.11]
MLIDVEATVVTSSPVHANSVMEHFVSLSSDYALNAVCGELDAEFDDVESGESLADGKVRFDFELYYRHLEYAPDVATAKKNAMASLQRIVTNATPILASFEGEAPAGFQIQALPETLSAKVFT